MYRGKDTEKVKRTILLEASGKVLVILDIFCVKIRFMYSYFIEVYRYLLSVLVIHAVEMRDIIDGKALHCQFLFLFQVLSLSLNLSLVGMTDNLSGL